MTITRHWTTPLFMLITSSLLPVALIGCLAQHADMKRVEVTLEKKITDLDRRERALEQKVDAAQKRIDQQTEYAKQLFQVARARSRQDLRNLQGEELASIQGRLENADSFLARSREEIAVLQQRLENLTQALRTQKAESAQQLQAQRDRSASLQSDQQVLREELGAVQQTLRDELGRVYAYVEALGPTLESLAHKIDLQIEEQEKAIQANAASTQSLGAHILGMQAALVTAMPDLAIPSLPEPSSGVTTSPPTPSDPPGRARQPSPKHPERSDTHPAEKGKDNP